MLSCEKQFCGSTNSLQLSTTASLCKLRDGFVLISSCQWTWFNRRSPRPSLLVFSHVQVPRVELTHFTRAAVCVSPQDLLACADRDHTLGKHIWSSRVRLYTCVCDTSFRVIARETVQDSQSQLAGCCSTTWQLYICKCRALFHILRSWNRTRFLGRSCRRSWVPSGRCLLIHSAHSLIIWSGAYQYALNRTWMSSTECSATCSFACLSVIHYFMFFAHENVQVLSVATWVAIGAISRCLVIRGHLRY